MNKEELIKKISDTVLEGYNIVPFEKIVVRLYQRGPATGAYSHAKVDGKYLNDRQLGRIGYEISDELDWDICDIVSDLVKEDFRMVLVINRDSTYEIEDEVFDSDNEGIDNAIWFYKYLGIVASENDRKYFENIEQTII